MNFIKKIFKSQKQPQPPVKKKKQRASFMTWLCATKPAPDQYDQRKSTNLQPLSQQSSTKRSILSAVAPTSNTKIAQRLSFGNDKSEYPEEQLKGQLINIVESRIEKIEDLLGANGLYGMINADEPLMNVDDECGIWLKIGKNQEINSLAHIKPYYFDKIFIFQNEFGGEYSIEDILKSKQNIYLKLQHKSSIQIVINTYEEQFTRHYAFKLMSECFSKLKITVFRTRRNDVWVQFNEQTEAGLYVTDILEQLGFDQEHEEYERLKDEIAMGLTLQEYIDILEHKEKLLSKYEGQNVAEYIKNKFLEKISRNGKTPRNESPRTAQKQKSNDEDKQSEQCHDYLLSVTSNTLPRQRLQETSISGQIAPRGQTTHKYPTTNNTNTPIEKNSYEEEIFEFNVYKDEKEQEAKRVAISKERKKRSRSEDITVNDLHNGGLDDDENDFFDDVV